MTSPYHAVAANLRDNGFHVMPVRPGFKVPGSWNGSSWDNLPGWSKFCDAMPPEFLHDKWEDWPDAGVCVAHGNIIGLDLDTDRKDVSEALHMAVSAPNVQRRGRKGWLGYYRPGDGLDGLTARVRWYDGETVTCELLLHGTQSVLPPSIHPETGAPYKWLTDDTLENTDISDLPVFTGDDLAALDREFTKIGLTRQAPKKGYSHDYVAAPSDARDLELPWGRSLNNRAMEPSAIDQWWPALGLPKTKQRSVGAWEAVATWRASGSGRLMSDRNPNLKITPSGIRDFGDDKPYTPLDLVVHAHACDVGEAARWLGQYIRPEDGMDISTALKNMSEIRPVADVNPRKCIDPEPDSDDVAGASALDRFLARGDGHRKPVSKIQPSSVKSFTQAFPDDPVQFPIKDFERDLTGLLRSLTLRIDAASRMRSEQGAFGAALSLMSVALGGKIELAETGLRPNLYILGTANSGAGKSSSMAAMKKVSLELGVMDRLGGSDFTSGSAILKELSDGANKLFCIDEFGDVMRRILGAKSASHEQDIRRILKDIYSAGDGVYQGKSKATESRVDITNPHMCLYGISTFEAFWEGLDGASFRDGLIARFISIPIGNTEVQRPSDMLREEVSKSFDLMLQRQSRAGNLSDMCPSPVLVDTDLYAQYEADWAMNQRHSERAKLMGVIGAPSIIMRISEMAMKIAMISAAGRSSAGFVVMTDEDYDLGMAVSHWSAISMIQAIQKYYIESETHRNVKKIVEIVENTGTDGATKRDIYRKTQGMTPRDRDDAIKTASESGDISLVEIKTSGRSRNAYYTNDSLRRVADDQEKNDKGKN